MTLKNAALLALIGTVLMTALLLWNFALTLLNVLRDLVPATPMHKSAGTPAVGSVKDVLRDSTTLASPRNKTESASVRHQTFA
jgi:hypothetical protein